MIQAIRKKADEVFADVLEARRHLHRHPELSFAETNTSGFVQDKLRALGVEFAVMSDTGVVALIRGKEGRNSIALRADMDALPILETNTTEYCSVNKGVMHACGHDVHTASLLGVARVLHESRTEWSGTVKLIFQPGEEKLPGGASLMIKAGVLENPLPSYAFAQHVFPELEAGKVGFRSGKYMASADEIYITVRGKGGHAALPHRLVDPVLIASHIIVALQQVVSRRSMAMTPSVLSFGKVVAEGATNVIPDEVYIAGTFRTFDEDWRMQAHIHIAEVAKGIARSMGGDCAVDIPAGYPFVYNDEKATDIVRSAAVEFLGAENVVDLEPRMTSEDFAFIAQVVPSCFYRLGTRAGANGPLRGLHTSTFDVDETCLRTAVGVMSWAAIQSLSK
jgi:amidohydrolase